MPLAEEAEKAMEDLPYPGAKPILNWTTRYILQARSLLRSRCGSRAVCSPCRLPRPQHVVGCVLQAGDDQYHPLNSKVECTVRMSDLQSEYGLSKEAIDFIKEVCGPRCVSSPLLPSRPPCLPEGSGRRSCLNALLSMVLLPAIAENHTLATAWLFRRYNKTSGVLRLVSTKYRDREDNRREVMRIIAGAVVCAAIPARCSQAESRPTERVSGAELCYAARLPQNWSRRGTKRRSARRRRAAAELRRPRRPAVGARRCRHRRLLQAKTNRACLLHAPSSSPQRGGKRCHRRCCGASPPVVVAPRALRLFIITSDFLSLNLSGS